MKVALPQAAAAAAAERFSHWHTAASMWFASHSLRALTSNFIDVHVIVLKSFANVLCPLRDASILDQSACSGNTKRSRTTGKHTGNKWSASQAHLVSLIEKNSQTWIWDGLFYVFFYEDLMKLMMGRICMFSLLTLSIQNNNYFEPFPHFFHFSGFFWSLANSFYLGSDHKPTI